MSNANQPAVTPDRRTLVQLLVCRGARPSPRHPTLRDPYVALVRAGLASEAPLGDGAYEYRITPAGLAHLDATRPVAS